MDPAEFRMKNFIRKDQFPYHTPTGWDYDSGDYHAALQKALDIDRLRRTCARSRPRSAPVASSWASASARSPRSSARGPATTSTSSGSRCSTRPRSGSTRRARRIVRLGVQSQGQGHETTFAQIVAEELGIPASKVKVEEGDTDTAPYGLGTYASRSTPTAGAATAIAARKIREKTRHLAAHLLECSPDDLEWTPGQWSVKGSPDRFKTIAELAFAAYTNHPAGMEAGLEATDYYDPPNLTFPFGSYICVVDIDKGTGAGQRPPVRRDRRLRQHHQPDDRGRADPRRPDDGPRPRAVRGDHVRRAGQQPRRDVHGLPPADGRRDARLGDRQDDHPLAAPPAGREGSGGVGHGRCAAGDRQRGRRRARATSA